MAKKNNVVLEEPKEEIASATHAADVGDSGLTPPRLYEVGTWSGLAHYRCMICHYDTLDEQAMKEHVQLGQHINANAQVEHEKQELIPSKHEATIVDTPDGHKLVGTYEINLTEVQDDSKSNTD